MLRKILKWAGIAVLVLVAAGLVLYALGLRVVLYGGGSPHLAFVESEDTRVARIARDREAQRAQPQPAPAPAPEAPHRAGGAGPEAGARRQCHDGRAGRPGVGILVGLPRPEPRRTLPGASDPHATGPPTG